MATYVVCIDGTWNRPADNQQGDPIDVDVETNQETNVYRMFRFLAGEVTHSQPRIPRTAHLKVDGPSTTPGEAFYIAGVGTSGNLIADQFDGATGRGTLQRILHAYRFLAERYRDGDRIFAFGFSRGAYAVRSLAGLLHHVGLPSRPQPLNDSELEDIGDRYKSRHTLPAPRDFRPVPVDFLGVWDTVGALTGDQSFHDVSPPNVHRVAHALALDEQRRQFAPTYWTPGHKATEVEEVWFAGVHSNVGGGYENPQLSNIALAWVVSKAVVDAGLPTPPMYIPQWYNENSMAPARDSHREFLAPLDRLGASFIKGSPRPRVILPAHGIHQSVFDRIERVVSDYVTGGDVEPVNWDAYKPAALLGTAPFPDTRTLFTELIAETEDYLPS